MRNCATAVVGGDVILCFCQTVYEISVLLSWHLKQMLNIVLYCPQ